MRANPVIPRSLASNPAWVKEESENNQEKEAQLTNKHTKPKHKHVFESKAQNGNVWKCYILTYSIQVIDAVFLVELLTEVFWCISLVKRE